MHGREQADERVLKRPDLLESFFTGISSVNARNTTGLKSLLPGYSSYQAIESRRNDDRMTRQWVVQRIDDCKSQLDSLGMRAASTGDFDTIMQIEGFRNELDRARSRVASAVEGYANWFSSQSVDQHLLKQLGQQDESLVSVVDLISTLIPQLPKSSEQLEENIQLLHQRIDRRALLLQKE